jgi:Rad3-related DNA helicase
MESEWNDKMKKKEHSMQAIWSRDYLERYIFSRYDHVFMLSGTILDKSSFCNLIGIDHSITAYHSIDSPFDVSKRKIIYMPLGKMSYANKEDTFKNYVGYISKILDKYNDKKGLIHTNSFELASWIERDVKDRRLMFHDSSNKDQVLNEHTMRTEPTVIVSPSMSTGVSFDDDLARFQIIAKVPYPSLASKRNKMRKSQDSQWYAYRTVSGIMQMSGRPVRSMNDWADTIIIDGSFGDVLRHSGGLLPEWFKQAITRVNVQL